MNDQAQEATEDLSPQQKADLEFTLLNRRSLVQSVLALSITAGFFALLFLLLFHAIPTSSQDLAEILFGNLGTIVAGIATHYFQAAMQQRQNKNGAMPKVVDTAKS